MTARQVLTFSIAFAIAASLCPKHTRAAEAPAGSIANDTELISVSFRTAPDCGDAQTIAQVVRDLVGGRRSANGKAEAKLDIQKSAAGYRVDLRFVDGTRVGHRTFDAESCEAAIDACTLVIAVALEPSMRWETALSRLAELRGNTPEKSVTPQQSESLPPPPVAPQPLPTPPLHSPPAPAPKPARREALNQSQLARNTDKKHEFLAHVYVAARALVDTATMPSWSGGVTTALGLDVRRWSLEAGALALQPRSVTIPGESERGVTLRLLGGELRVCRTSQAALALSFTVSPCAGALLAELSGKAFGMATRHDREPYAAATLGVETAYATTRRIATTAGLSVLFPLRSVSTVVDGIPLPLHRTATSLQLRLGLTWTL